MAGISGGSVTERISRTRAVSIAEELKQQSPHLRPRSNRPNVEISKKVATLRNCMELLKITKCYEDWLQKIHLVLQTNKKEDNFPQVGLEAVMAGKALQVALKNLPSNICDDDFFEEIKSQIEPFEEVLKEFNKGEEAILE